MKKLFLTAALAVATLFGYAQTVAQTFYFDFGSDVTNRGELTVNPDANGNYWNNITANNGNYAKSGTTYSSIVNSANESTDVTIMLSSRFTTNGLKGGGGLLSPSTELLGDLSIATATEDYFFIEKSEDNSSFNMTGLDPTKAYKFHVFASRSATQTRTGIYTMVGYNTQEVTLQAAGTDLGGTGVNQNNSTIAVSDYVFPDATGCIKFTVSRKTGDYIPLNCMKVVEYTNVDKSLYTQYDAVQISGTATGDADLAMTSLGENQFAAWIDMSEGTFTFSATADGETTSFGLGSADGTLANGGTAITATTGPQRIVVDLDERTYTVTSINSMSVVGSVTPAKWTLSSSPTMDYLGSLKWQFKGELTGIDTNSDPARFNFVMNKSWSYTIKRVDRTDNVSLSGGNDIYLNPGTYVITLDLAAETFKVENGLDDLDPLRITVMGSSVTNGQGADTTGEGYAWMYGNQLSSRYSSGASTSEFYISNISINGNSTVNLLERYDEMEREFGKYAVYGVSLGNEGIHGASDQDAIYTQFKTNMATLIDKARSAGKTPVVMNNYTRGDFTETDYGYIKKMDEDIETWDVPSVDLLGAIDNGAGQWADGYMAKNSSGEDDVYHPNSAGHQEMMYAMVPSLFDALASGKTLTMQRSDAAGMTLGNGKCVSFTPEGTVHPFTLMFTFTASDDTHLATVNTTEGDMSLDVVEGSLRLTLPDCRTSDVEGTFADGAQHTAFLSQHYAQGFASLMVDGAGNSNIEDVQFQPTFFAVGGGADESLTVGELFFYRSAKLATDDLFNGSSLHKSSLEIYVPLDGTSSTQENLAMSMNTVSVRCMNVVYGDMTVEGTTSTTHAGKKVTCSGEWVEEVFKNIDAYVIDLTAVTELPATISNNSMNPNAIVYAASTTGGTNVCTAKGQDVVTLSLADGHDFAPEKSFSSTDITYSVALTSGHYSFVFLPFGVSEIQDGAHLYSIKSAEVDKIVIEEVAAPVTLADGEGGKVFVIKGDETATYTIKGSGTCGAIASEAENTTSSAGLTLVGTMVKKTMPANSYMFNKNNKLAVVTGESVTLHPFAAYIAANSIFNASQNAKVNVVEYGDEPTAIESIVEVNTDTAPLYNVEGQRVAESYKGLVIRNGKKFMKK